LMFGEQLRIERKKMRLSQRELSECLSGISQTYVSALERRDLPPNGRVLKQLSDFFNVPMGFWFTEYDKEWRLTPTEMGIIALLRDDRIDEVIELLQSFNELFASMGQREG